MDQFQFSFLLTGYGHRSNSWSQASWRVALAIYARCPVLFEDLKRLDILQLPCRRSLERAMAQKTVEDGISEERIVEQLALFKQYQTNAVLSGRPEPLGVGELLFDETKVIKSVLILILLPPLLNFTLCNCYSCSSHFIKHRVLFTCYSSNVNHGQLIAG